MMDEQNKKEDGESALNIVKNNSDIDIIVLDIMILFFFVVVRVLHGMQID